MKMTPDIKTAIRNALVAYCENFPTRNRASESLQGVSSATVSQICNGKFDQVSDAFNCTLWNWNRIRQAPPEAGANF